MLTIAPGPGRIQIANSAHIVVGETIVGIEGTVDGVHDRPEVAGMLETEQMTDFMRGRLQKTLPPLIRVDRSAN